MDFDRERFENFDVKRPIRLRIGRGAPEQAHVFDEESILAIRAALAARRPLLVRGEPGLGKTQLAVAAACLLARPLVPYIVNARTECTDLLWQFDSIRRLAEAQLCGAHRLSEEHVQERLDVRRFVVPGPLWWGFDWQGALRHVENCGGTPTVLLAGSDPAHGRVVLIDEIDKADNDVPNGLLEALGMGEFTPYGCPRVEALEPTPLVVVTTNEERVLPDPFVRRCLVLCLQLPSDADLIGYLVQRGRAHFQRLDERDDGFCGPEIADEILTEAAHMVADDRRVGVSPVPGVAEYLDLLRAVRELSSEGLGDPADLLRSVRRFTLGKYQRRPL